MYKIFIYLTIAIHGDDDRKWSRTVFIVVKWQIELHICNKLIVVEVLRATWNRYALIIEKMHFAKYIDQVKIYFFFVKTPNTNVQLWYLLPSALLFRAPFALKRIKRFDRLYDLAHNTQCTSICNHVNCKTKMASAANNSRRYAFLGYHKFHFMVCI